MNTCTICTQITHVTEYAFETCPGHQTGREIAAMAKVDIVQAEVIGHVFRKNNSLAECKRLEALTNVPAEVIRRIGVASDKWYADHAA